MDSTTPPIRILVADDEAAVLDAYRDVLAPACGSGSADLDDLRASLFDDDAAAPARDIDDHRFELTCVRTAEQAVEAVAEALGDERPFAAVFLDMRMPPGRDGAWAAASIRAIDARIDIVIATAYSDVDPAVLSRRVLPSSKMYYVQKPFHPHEIRQLALAIGARRQSDDRLWQLAYYDGLTGLPNRERFLEVTAEHLDDGRAAEGAAAVFFLDLNGFKHINDTLGHAAGDAVLRTTAQRIRTCIRDDDTVGMPDVSGFDSADSVARLGGDEFTVLLKDVSTGTASRVAERLYDALSKPMSIAGQQVRAVPSIGIALYPSHADESTALLKAADMAMYYAKRSTDGLPRLYVPEMSEAAVLRMNIEQGLRHVCDRGELELYYQPQLHLNSDAISAVEALLRWHNPVLGEIPPNRFIPIAEDIGEIVEIGAWVLNAACRQAQAWRTAGYALERMAVNVSVKQLVRADYPAQVERALTDSGLDPAVLELEITESVLMQDADSMVDKLRALKQLGVKLAIDDFGTGYSSLSYLKQFPIDRLKIDKSFVQEVLTSVSDQAISSAVIAMADQMEVAVTAEGVENVAQLEYLRESACDHAQGYQICRPMPATKVEAMLRQRGRRFDDAA